MVLSSFKGWLGEFKLRIMLYVFLGSKYKRFHNVTIRTGKYNTSQIDHIIVSTYGIFVIETKNYSGRIYGRKHSKYWTQKFGRLEYQFYSPLKQNQGHMGALRFLLKSKQYPMFSIVCFIGKARVIPNLDEVVRGGMRTIRLIKSRREKCISSQEVQVICNHIEQRRMANNWRTKRLHIKNIKRKYR